MYEVFDLQEIIKVEVRVVSYAAVFSGLTQRSGERIEDSNFVGFET